MGFVFRSLTIVAPLVLAPGTDGLLRGTALWLGVVWVLALVVLLVPVLAARALARRSPLAAAVVPAAITAAAVAWVVFASRQETVAGVGDGLGCGGER